MNSKIKTLTTLFLLLTAFTATHAQYFGEQVMEKSFEQTDFFFTPYRLLPFGLGNFRNSVSGVLNDPLINLELNPSYLYSDSLCASYLYLDFRSSREIRGAGGGVYPAYDVMSLRTSVVNDIRPYPFYYINTRKELEPVLSAAYLFRPTEGALKNLSLGLTYQMILQNEKYYAVPQDIYRSVVGRNYSGVAAAEAKDIPIVDKYSGADNIHQAGHFISFFGGYEIDPRLKVGLKFSRVSFDRDGEFGSKNLWENYHSSDHSSLWLNREGRTQEYGHWELTAGANYRIDEQYEVGLTSGMLWGDADQVLTRGDSSYWANGLLGSTTQNWSVYFSSGTQRQTWNHDGRTYFGGVNFKFQMNQSQLLQVHYLYSRQSTDIALAGTIFDTSFGRSRYQWDTNLTVSNSCQRLLDRRNGTGTSIGNIHRLVGSLQWEINPSVKVSIGGQYESRNIETSTSEAILANRHYRYSSTGPYAYNYFDSTAESKTLEWNFRSTLSRFTIPIFINIHASDVVEVLFGLNRSMAEWEVDDVTLAIFDYRVHSNQSGTTRKENFGERYTMPKERVSDIRTTFLAGLTVSPSSVFNIRLLVVPNFVDRAYEGSELSELQWWIGVNLLP
jgi:hypothetical protein